MRHLHWHKRVHNSLKHNKDLLHNKDQALDKIQIKILADRKTIHHNLARNKSAQHPAAAPHSKQAAPHNKHSLPHSKQVHSKQVHSKQVRVDLTMALK
jgi:hypothetical protein